MENAADNEVRYRLLKLLLSHPDWSQRQFAKELGVSLGKLNYCLRALVDLGFVKVGRFVQSSNKFNYRYLLTPKGLVEKAKATSRFLQRKEMEFEGIEREIAVLKRELRDDLKT